MIIIELYQLVLMELLEVCHLVLIMDVIDAILEIKKD
jgi:hypothetical protein